ncbi:phospholipid/glycerol acyltransferase [Desulfurispirillum indicum S5]|uniref:Phospholipid/glycerol acyltransferase n=1 Tax=Desulfurispirillum indicum (strain ATCC BAA-1389 / DSM 22839 / S5) TaxID=653733 RepID=E6W1F7_DESIS|nr:phospholipid/glycerol acyltransferase [Desulfurispirillum indicum S5]
MDRSTLPTTAGSNAAWEAPAAGGSFLLGVLSSLALLLYTLFLGAFLYVFILLRLILPQGLARGVANPMVEATAGLWVRGILWWLNHVYRVQWDIQGLSRIGRREWFLINANHQSWVDIFVLYALYLGKVPLLKFFIKRELAYLPIVGQAWWALDFPFMRRYSREYLARYPEKAGKDLEQTRRACEKFSQVPTSVMNFLEGTRFTEQKRRRTQSPFQYLLKPKAGGLAFAIQSLGDRFSALTNVTIYYPDGIPTFWAMMCGAFRRCVVRIDEKPIPAHFSQGDYGSDPLLRQEIQQWVTDIWQEKDEQLRQLHEEHSRRLPAAGG